jgi:ATP adenylyltransferase
MDRLWAPWRLAYVSRGASKKGSCFLCEALSAKNDKKHFIVERTKHSFSVLNLFPYNNGHVLVVPRRHVADIEKLRAGELADLMSLVIVTKRRLEGILKPHGFNIGINCGEAAGAGVPGHIHIHIVPRWNADTNFMPIFSDTKVISDSLETLYQRICTSKKKKVSKGYGKLRNVPKGCKSNVS